MSSMDRFLLSIDADSFKNASRTKCANNPTVFVMELKSDVLPDICENKLPVCVRRGPSQFKLQSESAVLDVKTGTIKTSTIQAT